MHWDVSWIGEVLWDNWGPTKGQILIGARSELKAALCEMNPDHVQDYLVRNWCEWIPFELNVPHSSHMGGTWERMIRMYATHLNHYCYKLAANLMIRHCEYSWQKSSALLIQDPSASITYVMQKRQSRWLLTIFLLWNLKECYRPQESFKEPICIVVEVEEEFSILQMNSGWDGGESIFNCYKSGKSGSSLRETLLFVIQSSLRKVKALSLIHIWRCRRRG